MFRPFLRHGLSIDFLCWLTGEVLSTAAGSVQADAVETRGDAGLDVAELARPSGVAFAHATDTVTVEGAVADTHLRLARLALEPGVTHARTVHEADTVAGTLPRAPAHRTIHTGPANFADTRTLVADAVARALVLAGGDRAVLTFEAWV